MSVSRPCSSRRSSRPTPAGSASRQRRPASHQHRRQTGDQKQDQVSPLIANICGWSTAPADRASRSTADPLPPPSFPARRPSHDSQGSSAYGGITSDGGSQYGGSQYSNSPYSNPAALPPGRSGRPPITSSRSPAGSYSGSESGLPPRNAGPPSRSALGNGSTGRDGDSSRSGAPQPGRRSGDEPREPRKLSAESRSYSNESNASSQAASRSASSTGLRAPVQPSPLNPTPSPKPSAAVPPLRSTPSTSSMRQTATPKISVSIPPSVPPPQKKSSVDVLPSPTIRVSSSPTVGRPTESPLVSVSSPLRSNSPKVSSSPLPPPPQPSAPITKSTSSSSLLAPSPSASSLAPPSSNGAAPAPTPSTSRAHRKLSLLPPPLQTSFSRDLLLSDDPLTPAGHDEGEDVILANVEEMLEGWDWSALTLQGSLGKAGSSSTLKDGGKGEMERRLADELGALEAVSVHDSRVPCSPPRTDTALCLDYAGQHPLVPRGGRASCARARTYRSGDPPAGRDGRKDPQLQDAAQRACPRGRPIRIDQSRSRPAPCFQAVSDDISYIESQNRGLQVQTSNQKALLAELENLLVRAISPRPGSKSSH